MEVTPLPAHMLLLGALPYGPCTMLAALRLAGHNSVRFRQVLPCSAVAAWILSHIPLRCDEEGRQPDVGASLFGEGASLRSPFDGTGLGHRNAPNLREPQIAVIQPSAVAKRFVGEGVGAPVALKPREPRVIAARQLSEEHVIRSCPAGPVHRARHGSGWNHTPAGLFAGPSLLLPADSG